MQNNCREMIEDHFITEDGVEIFYRYWPALVNDDEKKGAVLLFHRGHEHSGRIAHLVDELTLPEQAFFAWDARGNGRSGGERGDAPSFATLAYDVQLFVEHLINKYHFKIETLSIVAQSVGAVIATTWVHDYAPNIRAMVLASPAFKVKLYVPFALTGLRLLKRVKGNFFINSYVKSNLLTHDQLRRDSYNSDPLITRPISVNVLLGLYDVSKRLVANANKITVPTQILISGNDFVVRRKPQLQFYQGLSNAKKELHILPGFYHDTLGEKDRQEVVGRVRRFLTANNNWPDSPPCLLHDDQIGQGCAESEVLSMPLTSTSLQFYYWSMIRKAMNIGKRLSDGVKLGFDTGFDSGSTMDYVYRNQPSGNGYLGKLVDRIYLNAIGWRGIRQRKENIKLILNRAIQQTHQTDSEIRILDIAAGHGRYILETIKESMIKPASVLLRDYSDLNVRDGQALIEQLDLIDLARFEKGNAFDADSIANVAPQPNIILVSGLYELFGDNQLVSQSLSGIARALPPGGILIYTCQPWHPQLEFIAKALSSHREGQPWVMRCRSQQEMDQLVAYHGFEKITQRTDEWGIFTVSLARKIN